MFEVFRRWRRGRIISRYALDAVLWTRTLARLKFLRGLSDAERSRLREEILKKSLGIFAESPVSPSPSSRR